MIKRNLALIGFPVAKLLIHLLTFRGYGMFRDEYYYLACADHLDWGYVDHPPLSIAILWLFTRLFGDSLFVVRLVPALAGAWTVYLVGRMARQLGGGRAAETLAMSCALLAPVYLALNHFYSMNALDILLWALAASLWISALETPRRRSWLLLGAVLGLGLLNKISVLWLGFGLGVGLLATPTRRQLSTAGPYLAVAVALTLFLPHLLWQILHGWPTVEFIRNATSNKMVEVALGDFAWGQIESMNIATVVVWLSGLVWLGLLGGRLQRSLAVAYLAVFALLALSGSSRAGYLSPAYTWLFAAGGVALERLHARWRPRLLRGAILACIVVVGAASAPFALPILPVDSYIRYAEAAGVAPSTAERKELAQLPQFYADMHGWEEIVETVAAVFAELPPDEQKEAAIFVYNYGEAGAIDRLGRRHGLPRAIGGHNNYWLWGHRGHSGKVVLVVGGDEEGLSRAFETVELAATIDCGRCMPYENRQPVWVCRDILTPLEELWPRQRHFD